MTTPDVKYPEVEVQLTGTDGNAMSIIARVGSALRGAGVKNDEVKAFYHEAMSGDYDNVLSTATRWVTVE